MGQSVGPRASAQGQGPGLGQPSARGEMGWTDERVGWSAIHSRGAPTNRSHECFIVTASLAGGGVGWAVHTAALSPTATSQSISGPLQGGEPQGPRLATEMCCQLFRCSLRGYYSFCLKRLIKRLCKMYNSRSSTEWGSGPCNHPVALPDFEKPVVGN